MRWTRRSRLAVVLSLLVTALVVGTGVALVLDAPHAGPGMAPSFKLTSIYGQPFNLTTYHGNSVVVIEFTSLSCSACQVVEKSLASLYAVYNRTGTTDVHLISIYINPTFGDTISALKSYHHTNNITWTMAQGTPAVAQSYPVVDIPVVVIIDKQGHAVYESSGVQSTSVLETSINNALGGHAPAIAIVTVSVFALAMIAGVTTFFSPCAFPMFPGYMSLFLGLNVTAASATASKRGAYSTAARRALSAGTVSALGMMIVFLLIGVALLFAAQLVGGYIPYFLVVVGAILIGLGALLLTNLQYWRIVTPFQSLWGRITGRSNTAVAGTPVLPTDGRRLYFTLFGYGMGYAAAAAGCVAPVILSAVVAGLALGTVSGLLTIVIFSLTAALLMIGVTLLIALAGQRYVNQLKAYTPIIKKISAAALVIVGVYLIYFYWTAWVAPSS